MDMNKIKNCLEFIRDVPINEFYIALLLYERLNISAKDLNKNLVAQANKILNQYEHIYIDELRDDIDKLEHLTKNSPQINI